VRQVVHSPRINSSLFINIKDRTEKRGATLLRAAGTVRRLNQHYDIKARCVKLMPQECSVIDTETDVWKDDIRLYGISFRNIGGNGPTDTSANYFLIWKTHLQQWEGTTGPNLWSCAKGHGANVKSTARCRLRTPNAGTHCTLCPCLIL
jgi:hypothetical protein